ncbi:MAG: hypothetical protein NUV77_10690 [Thermoguttaceae bacterium]|jgi:hypothetical protein|nr:hypothetical protein [Thermoguttaceae bacterium]
MRIERSSIRTLVAMVAGAGVALVVSTPAFILGAVIAATRLAPFPEAGDLPLVLPFLAVIAFVLGLPGAFLGARSVSRRARYAMVVTPVVSAAISGLPVLAVCLVSQASPLDPAAFTILFGVTVSGFFSGLASHAVAAKLRWLVREEPDRRTAPHTVATPSQAVPAAMRAVSWPGFGLLVVGTPYVVIPLFCFIRIIGETGFPGPQPPALFYFALSGALGMLMIVGGSMMRSLRHYRWAVAAAIAAMVSLAPCLYVLFLGFPVGLWALVVLLDPKVKEAFRH